MKNFREQQVKGAAGGTHADIQQWQQKQYTVNLVHTEFNTVWIM